MHTTRTIAALMMALIASLAPQSAFAQPCVGDCNNDRSVRVDELVTGVNVALGARSIAQCRNLDADADQRAGVSELVTAVNGALEGCPAELPIDELVTHGFADNDGVKIHYATLGEGPLIVMLHGFPDYWYTWRHQMRALSADHQVVAIDLRGYNLSDAPQGEENYDLPVLVSDVVAVIHHLNRDRAVIVGHDFGGGIAWTFALLHPEMTERLIICNLPHPLGFLRELVNNPQQYANTQYARNLQKDGAYLTLNADLLALWVTDAEARPKYLEALRRSNLEAMVNYYRRVFPREPYTIPTGPVIKVKPPVLMIHGLGDQFLLPGALNDTWQWLEGPFTLVTIPGAGHFVQQDAADLVTRTMQSWLAQ